MLDKLKHIKTETEEFPIAFTLNVMETIQEQYGSMEAWSKALKPEEEGKEPQIKDVIWTFREFINEGIDIENERTDKKRPFLTHKQVGRLISHIGFNEINEIIQSLTVKSTVTEEAKNS